MFDDINRRDLLSVIVPTIDSELYIDIIMDYYRSYDVDPIIYLDVKCRDRSSAILRNMTWGRKEIRLMPNKASRIGEMVGYFSREAGTPWILRLDDDELPSIGLLTFVAHAITRDDADVYGFPRHQCIVTKDGKLLTHRGHDPYRSHRQWRLYRADRVRYISRGHSPGFELPPSVRRQEAPDYACMIHLDWSVHSYSNRKEKILRYDNHTKDHGSVFRDYYLFEEKGIPPEELIELDLPEFSTVCRDLSRRHPELCVDTLSCGWPPLRNATP